MTTNNFKTYFDKYRNIRLERHGGILEVTFGDKQTLVWTPKIRSQVSMLFEDIAKDENNQVVILSGYGEHFWKESEQESNSSLLMTDWCEESLLECLMRIPIPIIAAINGSVRHYCEIPLISDIVLVAEGASLQENQSNLAQSLSDKEARRLVLHSLLGPNRARYFLLTEKIISAREAKEIGLVAEILSRKDLLNRAREIAFMLMRRSSSELRKLRASFLLDFKRQLDDSLGTIRIWGADGEKRLKNDFARYRLSEDEWDVSKNTENTNMSHDFDRSSAFPEKKIESRQEGLEIEEIEWESSFGEENDDTFSLHGQDIDTLSDMENDKLTDEFSSRTADSSNRASQESRAEQVGESSFPNDELVEIGDETKNVSQAIKSVSVEGGENDVKLNLAKAYLELGYYPSARLILEEVLKDGTTEQISEANSLREEILSYPS